MPMKQPRLPGYVIYEDGGYDRDLAKQSVGAGWAGLIDEIFDMKEASNLTNVRIVQVKEKFAGLRVYIDAYEIDETHPVHQFEKFLHEAERRSFKICETCGRPGVVRGKRWYYTSCDEHAEPGDLPHGDDNAEES
jgi:hypothetical protein